MKKDKSAAAEVVKLSEAQLLEKLAQSEKWENSFKCRGMSVEEMNDAQQQMDSLSGKFFAVAEGYPELRTSDVFVELQRGIRDAEEHLQAARRLYNSSVTAYNTAIAMFPAKLLAGSRQPKEFFAADSSKREDVKMSFRERKCYFGRKADDDERTVGGRDQFRPH